MIYCISRNTSKHWDPKVRSDYILDRGQKEIASWNTWSKISHYLSEKNKNTPFYIKPTTLIWASTDRHLTNSFSSRPPHWVLILVHSAIESQYCCEIHHRSAQREGWREIKHYTSSGINLIMPLFFQYTERYWRYRSNYTYTYTCVTPCIFTLYWKQNQYTTSLRDQR